MTRLRPFVKDSAFKKKTSNKSIWSLLCASILVITIVFRSYAKYIYTSGDILFANSNTGEFYFEELLNGAYPVLSDDLTPITIAQDGSARKANIKEEWYKYEDKRWANAVKTRNSYDTLNAYGKINGATKNNGYVSFDGVDDYIDLGLAGYNFGDSFSIAVRFKISDLSVTTQLFNCFELAGFGIDVTNSSLIRGTVHNGEYQNILSTTKIEDDVFYTALLTYDGSVISLYIDGVLEASSECTGNVSVKVPFLLGANPYYDNAHTEFGRSDISQAVILDRVVDSEEALLSFSGNIDLYNREGLLVYEDFSNDVYVENEIIPEDSIESYFVWIPKYSYQLWDLGNYNSLTNLDNTKPHSIGIRFGTINTSDGVIGECTSPRVAGSSGNCNIGDYMTHPAFLSFDTNGLWVGKFETGYDGATTTTEAEVNGVNIEKVVIKPNIYSWRAPTIGNMFKTSYNYLRENESHMMKNTEWGAVAYLSHSIYGINQEVMFNNNSNHITGYSSVEAPSLGYNSGESIEGNRNESVLPNDDGTFTVNYFNSNSTLSSTTGNYSGIYDMSGGSWEYVLGYTSNSNSGADASDIKNIFPDFFTNLNWNKYYDKYVSTLTTDYYNRILGDATAEMGPYLGVLDPDDIMRPKLSWYGDYGDFVNTSVAWFGRGGCWTDGATTGLFAAYGTNGRSHFRFTFRIVLAPKN